MHGMLAYYFEKIKKRGEVVVGEINPIVDFAKSSCVFLVLSKMSVAFFSVQMKAHTNEIMLHKTNS